MLEARSWESDIGGWKLDIGNRKMDIESWTVKGGYRVVRIDRAFQEGSTKRPHVYPGVSG